MTALPEQLEKGLGYLVDQSHPPLFFAAVLGIGEILEHGLWGLDRQDRDVSPIIVESQNRMVVINLYEPEPVTVQVVQYGGPLDRMTEVVGAGFGLGVLAEIRRTTKVFNLELAPLTDRFVNRITKEKMTYVQTYGLFRGEEHYKRQRFGEVLRSLQQKHRRDTSLLRDLL